MAATETTNRPRRTQAERRATTRAALLEATIDSLVESGYAAVTTAEIAQRANVTRGAQAHHFGNKAELVTEAVRHLTRKLIEEHLQGLVTGPPGLRAIGRVLDELWQMHRSPAYAAAIELWSAARTDPELRASLSSLEADVMSALRAATKQVLLDRTTDRRAAQLLSTTTATMRGLALLSFVHPDVDAEWKAARRDLIHLWSRLGADAA